MNEYDDMSDDEAQETLSDLQAANNRLARKLAETLAQRDGLDKKLSDLLSTATANRKDHYKRSISDPDDKEWRDAYYYEEGRTRAYSDALAALKGDA